MSTIPMTTDTLDPDRTTGYIEIPLPVKKTPVTMAWQKTWPPPRLLAVVVTQSGRFPASSLALDAIDWIDGTTIVPNADIAYFYVLAELQEPITVKVQDQNTMEWGTRVIDVATAKYRRTLSVTAGPPQ